ncbi:MAG: hypothetical protein A2Z91_02150 [Deltaproteobacteria bacterium GWA2_38_16]|nr:MAG: hypothetical protein A2Z91_02150 [Deltaproteobacteria bacterium GWA2_38_16]OGQ01998.1 MAG: hypothetical protein A3D19_08445 [Deltaproteobacteria bacterium RIFCSPHIGHO2_02_FULL_38_15]OGQ33691.1 MAG: hypothetical protein A3A72_05710 [Deltaproteobacteria bacterium RIFCSPLOWO2_01_FULL_38_9]OGQ61048.1 MAG: hypothetical protein A3G92_01915 [Deltaproteobacteria bacterium RIFCSPLOWO2_12_FULL_38_8]HBQ21531.1 hypothetical protein [Deltaproteobacteria bacterium]
MNHPIHVAITGLQMMDNPYPGVSVARSLKESPSFSGKIIGLSYDLHCTGNFSPYFDDIFLTPFPWDSETQWLNRIAQIHQKIRLDVIIPTLDSEIALFSKMSLTLEKMGIKTFLPSEMSVKARAKNFLPEWCKTHQIIKTPKTMVVVNKSEIAKIVGTVGYPCLIKGALADAYIAYDIYEASVFFDRIYYGWGLPVIIQECIKGDDFDVVALAGKDSTLIGATAIKKLAITDQGKCAIASIVNDEQLFTLTQKIAHALKWVGPFEVEMVYDGFNKEFYLIEINARFPAWIYLTAKANYNLPEKLVQLAMGENVSPLPPCQSELLFTRTKEDYFFEVNAYSKLAATGELKKGDLLCENL